MVFPLKIKLMSLFYQKGNNKIDERGVLFLIRGKREKLLSLSISILIEIEVIIISINREKST